MQECWSGKPRERPQSFTEIRERLTKMFEASDDEVGLGQDRLEDDDDGEGDELGLGLDRLEDDSDGDGDGEGGDMYANPMHSPSQPAESAVEGQEAGLLAEGPADEGDVRAHLAELGDLIWAPSCAFMMPSLD